MGLMHNIGAWMLTRIGIDAGSIRLRPGVALPVGMPGSSLPSPALLLRTTCSWQPSASPVHDGPFGPGQASCCVRA